MDQCCLHVQIRQLRTWCDRKCSKTFSLNPVFLAVQRQVTSGEQNLFNKNRTEPTHHPHLILGPHKQCCHSAQSLKAESQNLWSSHEPSPSGRGGTFADGGWGPGIRVFHRPSSALTGTFSLGEKVFLHFLKQWILQLRAGMPFVQNDILETLRTDSWAFVTWCNFMNVCCLHAQIDLSM